MAKHKYIESSEILWNHFERYKEHIKSKPFKIKDWVGKDALDVYREKERPLTMEGFECFLADNDIICDLSHYFANYENRYAEFLAVCSRIKKSIRQDQIEGGMAGMYNPSITQRLNGLVEKTQTDVNVTKFEFDE